MAYTPTRLLSALLLSLIALPVLADDFSAQVWNADATAGATLYASTCVACHGAGGNSIVPEQPVLAGQHPAYIVKQLMAFRAQKRVSAIMLPFVQNLSDNDIFNVAAYLSSQQGGLSGATDKELVTIGETIYRKGIVKQAVPNCSGCHGPNGQGIPPIYPRISGQHAAYVGKTLRALRDGTRTAEAMNSIAVNLSDSDIDALAEYISGLY